MTTQIKRWGHSLAVRIPKVIAEQLDIGEGADVDLVAVGGQLVITPVARDYDLDSLVDGVTEENLHAETDWGPPRGRELW